MTTPDGKVASIGIARCREPYSASIGLSCGEPYRPFENIRVVKPIWFTCCVNIGNTTEILSVIVEDTRSSQNKKKKHRQRPPLREASALSTCSVVAVLVTDRDRRTRTDNPVVHLAVAELRELVVGVDTVAEDVAVGEHLVHAV